MFRIRQTRVARYVAAMLVLTMYIFPAVCAAKSPKAVLPPAKTILVFPFEDSTKWASESLSKDIQVRIQNGLSSTGSFTAVVYSEALPSIQRAVLETSLKKDDLKGPFGIEKSQIDGALKIAREAAADLILVGSVDDAKVDTTKHTGQVTITTMLVDVRTGEGKTVAVTGNAPTGAAVATESDLVYAAGSDAATRLVKVTAPDQAATPIQTVSVKKKKNYTRTIVIGLLLGLTVGLLASNSNSSNGSAGTVDNPPGGPFN